MAGGIPLSIGISLVGQASKRGVRRQVPAPGPLMDDLEAWLRKDAGEMLVSARRLPPSAEHATFRARLHPAGGEVDVSAFDGGRVTATGSTAEVGPGYHTYLAQVFRRLGTDNGIAWAATDEDAGTGDLTGAFRVRQARGCRATAAGVAAAGAPAGL